MVVCETCDCVFGMAGPCFGFFGQDGGQTTFGFVRSFPTWGYFEAAYTAASGSTAGLLTLREYREAYDLYVARAIQCRDCNGAAGFQFAGFDKVEVFGYQTAFPTWDDFAAAYRRQADLFLNDVLPLSAYRAAYDRYLDAKNEGGPR